MPRHTAMIFLADKLGDFPGARIDCPSKFDAFLVLLFGGKDQIPIELGQGRK